ncbi:hypothetical protein PVAND_004573 [Polypedilum vanderplanki]|uniref:Polymerase nucleotidyl transferase domain-containing protein n=1 Tax=Polypedilum vanderplanki TaxID=319348 RepID=A0A9J6BYJ1_POLVA|nr:hypothetical protein PVAND_004573 [Polypedilum vanderplanki]
MKPNGRKTRIFLDNCDVVIDAAYNEGIALKNDSKNESLKNTLEMLLEKFFHINVKVHFFGSRVIGLASDKSDLDIFIEIDNNFHNDKHIQRDAKVLREISLILKSHSSLWQIKSEVPVTSVPVLKTIYIPRNLECDIVASNGLGVRNSMMLGYIFNLQPEAMKFYHFMRVFLPRYDINFDGYLLKLLVIFYFQNENLLPSILKVQEGLHSEMIGGWNVQFDAARDLKYYKMKPISNFKHYVANFFEFYATFNYHKNVMSVHHGIKKNRAVYSYNDEIKVEYMLCIFGPINLKHNIGKYLKKPKVYTFMLKCEGIFFGFLKYHPWNVAYEKMKEDS